MNIPRSARRTLAALFVSTGATALIAEQAYEKLLETLLGTSTHAAASVLTIYFAGLTLGAWSYRWWRRSSLRPLRIYAVLECAVGLWALVLYFAFEHLINAFVPLLRLGTGSFAGLTALRLLVASIWILPPTLFMGATFPAIVDALHDQLGSTRRDDISFFYALNLLGATAAAAAGPYVVFARAGVDGALLLTTLDVVVGLAAWNLGRTAPEMVSNDVSRASAHDEPAARVSHRLLLIGSAAVCGFLFFALEVVWTHLIAAVCGNTIYAFASMLTAVLAGLFIGGAIASRILPSRDDVPAAAPATMLALGGLAVAIQQMVWPHVPHTFTLFGSRVTGFAGAELLRAAVAAVVLMPPSAILGSVFPMLFRLREFPAAEQGRTASTMTAANTIGCCAGALLTAFVAIPSIGSEAVLLIIAMVYSIAGAAILFATASGRQRAVGFGAVAIALLVSGLAPQWDRLRLTSGEHVYFEPMFVSSSTKLFFFHEDSAGGITTVVSSPKGTRVLLTNGKFQGSDGGELAAQIGFAAVPTLFTSRFDDALVVGVGTGQSGGAVQAAGFHNVEVAEIAPGMLVAAQTFFGRVNRDFLAQPNVHIHLEDGRNLLLLDEKKYDLITMEISSIWFAGATNLYSRNFYELAAARMKPHAVLQQWIQLHHTTPREIASILLTIRKVFPYVSLWSFGGQGIAVATMEPQVMRAAGVQAAVRIFGSYPGSVDSHGLCSLLSGRMLSPEDVTRLERTARGTIINTDRNRWLEYQTPRYNLAREDLAAMNAKAIRQFADPRSPFAIEPEAARVIGSLCGSGER